MTWQKQDPKKPLYPDLIWSRPENKNHAGKLLLIGGKAGEFINVSSTYILANKAGAGIIRTLLPDSLQQIGKNIDEVEFSRSNQGGGFAKTALADFFDLSDWADQVLLAGDFGKNAETTVILDGYLLRSQKPIVLSQKALTSISLSYEQLLKLPVTLVITRDELRKIAIRIGSHIAVTSTANFETIKEVMFNISSQSKANLVIIDQDNTWVAVNGNIISTKTTPIDINTLAAYVAVWQMQNPDKPLQALATAVYEAVNI